MSERKHTRSYNSVVNSVVGIITAVVNIIISFLVRIVIVRVLGDEINGIHSLFQNIIMVLTLLETTMSTAMIFHLYRPVKENDAGRIEELMSLYRKLYSLLALVVFVAGLILNLFLPLFVETTVDMWKVHLYFVLFTLSFVLYYLTFSNRCILYAEQKNRISTVATMAAELIFRGAGMLLVMWTRDYLVFLLLLIGEKLFSNLICNLYIRKNHPYLKLSLRGKTDVSLRKKVFATVRPLFVNQVALTVQNSSTSVIIGALLGNVSVVGFYGNYQMIINAVNVMMAQVGASFTSSAGNLFAEGDKAHMGLVFRRVLFLISSLGTVCCCVYMACVDDFIALAFGENSVLEPITTILLTLNMFVMLVDIPAVSVQNATGTHRLDQVNMVIQVIAVIALSFVGGSLWGLNGIVLGLVLPTMCFTTIGKGIIIGRACLDQSASSYLIGIALIFAKCTAACAATAFVCSLLHFSSPILSILVKGVTALLIAASVIAATSIKNENFRFMLKFLHLTGKG